jgi:hypothetical protein
LSGQDRIGTRLQQHPNHARFIKVARIRERATQELVGLIHVASAVPQKKIQHLLVPINGSFVQRQTVATAGNGDIGTPSHQQGYHGFMAVCTG